MSEEVSENDIALWNELVQSYDCYALARQAFFQGSIDRVALIRRALPTSDRLVAVGMAQYLSPAEHIQLFDEWVRWSRALPAARDYILSLPREWVLERIEQAVEPNLCDADEQIFRRYLELYYTLDPDLTAKLVKRALEHPDDAIQEAGKDFLSRLEEDQAPEKE